MDLMTDHPQLYVAFELEPPLSSRIVDLSSRLDDTPQHTIERLLSWALQAIEDGDLALDELHLLDDPGDDEEEQS